MDKSMFDYLSDHPEKAKFFANAMRSFARRPGLEPKYIVENYPWGSLSDGSMGEFRQLLCTPTNADTHNCR